MVVFLAEGVEPGEPDPDADEEVEVLQWPADGIDALLPELEDAKTVAGLLLFLRARRAS